MLTTFIGVLLGDALEPLIAWAARALTSCDSQPNRSAVHLTNGGFTDGS